MTEPTDEQVAAFKAAWGAESARTYSQPGDRYRPGDRTRAGLRAVFALSDPFADRPMVEYLALHLADRTMWTDEDWRYVIALANRTASPFAAGPQSRPYEPTPHRGTYVSPTDPHPFSGYEFGSCTRCGLPQARIDIHLIAPTPHEFVPFDDRLHANCETCGQGMDYLPHRIWQSLPAEEELAPAPTLGPRWVDHEFVGRLDRDCEHCGLPDRASVHIAPPTTGHEAHPFDPLPLPDGVEIGVPLCRFCGRSRVAHLDPYVPPPMKNPTTEED